MQSIYSEPAPGQGARAHRFNDDIGLLDQVEVRLDGLLLAEVEDDRALSAVDVQREEGGFRSAAPVVKPHDRPGHLPPVVAAGWLHLDHLGAQVGEESTHLRRTEHRTLDHPHSTEQTGGRRHSHNICVRAP